MIRKLTPRMREAAEKIGIVEAKSVKYFRRVLAMEISNHGSLRHAAQTLAIDVSTLSRWCQILDIELRTTRTTIAHTIAVLPEQEAEREGEEEPVESVEA